MVVVASPPLDEYLRFPERVEDFPIEKLVPQFSIEAFAMAVLPCAAVLNVQGLHAEPTEPSADRDFNVLGSIVGSDVLRRPMHDEDISQGLKHALRVEPPVDLDCQTLAGVPIDDHKHAKRLAVVGGETGSLYSRAYRQWLAECA